MKKFCIGFLSFIFLFGGMVLAKDVTPYDLGKAMRDVQQKKFYIQVELPQHLPGIDEQSLQGNASDVTVFLQRFANGIAGIAGSIAVIFIIINAFGMAGSAGNTEAIEKAKKGLIWSIAGLVLIIMAYVIVKTVLSLSYSGQEIVATKCNDGIDNDGDGFIDTDDMDCFREFDDRMAYDPTINSESGAKTECIDGIDNGGDGYIDNNDFNCWRDFDDRSTYDPTIQVEDPVPPKPVLENFLTERWYLPEGVRIPESLGFFDRESIKVWSTGAIPDESIDLEEWEKVGVDIENIDQFSEDDFQYLRDTFGTWKDKALRELQALSELERKQLRTAPLQKRRDIIQEFRKRRPLS